MKEIKFRAWDKERKEMRDVQLMDWSDWWVSTGNTWERGNQLEYGERNSFKNEDTDRHILMQYTGLEDKNGIEIFKGDICEVEYKSGKKFINDIRFLNAAFTFRSYYLHRVAEDVLDEFCTIRVAGNIYENPELLEVTP